MALCAGSWSMCCDVNIGQGPQETQLSNKEENHEKHIKDNKKEYQKNCIPTQENIYEYFNSGRRRGDDGASARRRWFCHHCPDAGIASVLAHRGVEDLNP